MARALHERDARPFTRTDAGAWPLVDQATADDLTLASIELSFPMGAVFKGVERAA